ncbi:alanine racemase [Corynebacterium sp. zg254]|uniref:Alanine racemase n=1 Tax=Corynebacterium zhongnanshanii TaxID=2768834 RepID=A0ABQ6VEP1_9CORY|nr:MULTISPECIES: alanine racemase [Corynebacterium]KAB3522896.1 alanine racemase [Corynebacterium zhongnanshanii]MCR5914032.1 alanine racemase [Corynebacterium sp. zg254]
MTTSASPSAQPTAPTHPVLAEVIVDISAIRANVRTLVDKAAPAQVMAIVKADGYNHGASVAAQAALDGGAQMLGVATCAEALSLRTQGFTCPITAWMWIPGEPLEDVFAEDITVGIPSLAHAEAFVQAAAAASEASGIRPKAGLMVDTGLSRSGISPVELDQVIDFLAQHAQTFEMTGAFSHLASADMDAGREVTDLQAARFNAAIAKAEAAGLAMPANHLANTPALLSRPDLRYQVVRPGVSVYGIDPMETPTDTHFAPAMTLRARVVTTRTVQAGEGVSYGHLWHAQQDTTTAVVALGYADGIPRSASGKFSVAINGTRYPQIGRVCMDQFVVDLGQDHSVKPGDWAVVFGHNGPHVDEFAQASGTISYENLTLPRGPRVARRVVNSAEEIDGNEAANDR